MTVTIFSLWIIAHSAFSYMMFVLGVAVTQTLPELNKSKEDPKLNIVAVEQKFPSLVLKDYK